MYASLQRTKPAWMSSKYRNVTKDPYFWCPIWATIQINYYHIDSGLILSVFNYAYLDPCDNFAQNSRDLAIFVRVTFKTLVSNKSHGYIKFSTYIKNSMDQFTPKYTFKYFN